MKVIFASSVRYPTEKAYGVTIGETAYAAAKYFSKVEIWSPNAGVVNDEFSNQVVGTFGKFYKIEQRLNQLISKINSRLAFYIRELFFVAFALNKLFREDNETLLWTRNRFLCLLNSVFFPSRTSLLEEHYLCKGFNLNLIKILMRRRNIYIGLLTNLHMEHYGKEHENLFLLPMAAPSNFFDQNSPSENSTKNHSLRFGFIGSSASSGNESGIRNFIIQFFEISFKEPVEFHLIGLDVEDMRWAKNLKNLYPDKNIKIVCYPRVPHHELPIIARNFEVGIVPYVNSAYNLARFPIKIVEYAALGKLILLSDTVGNRNVADDSFAFFYQLNDPNSLNEVIKEIIAHDIQKTSKHTQAFLWAHNFTYENRIKCVLTAIDKLHNLE